MSVTLHFVPAGVQGSARTDEMADVSQLVSMQLMVHGWISRFSN